MVLDIVEGHRSPHSYPPYQCEKRRRARYLVIQTTRNRNEAALATITIQTSIPTAVPLS